jgi:hypothetical protein
VLVENEIISRAPRHPKSHEDDVPMLSTKLFTPIQTTHTMNSGWDAMQATHIPDIHRIIAEKQTMVDCFRS